MAIQRVMPRSAELVAEHLRAEFTGDGVTVETVPTGDVYGRTPYVLVRETASGETPRWPLLDAPTLDVECWHAPSKEDAMDLAEACRVVLYRNAATSPAIGGGYLARVVTVSYPTERAVGGQPGGIYYVPATYQVWIRPAR